MCNKIITVKVNTKQKDYNVIIGQNILTNAGDYISSVKSKCKIVIISDSNVCPIYSETIKKSLTEKGFECFVFEFEAGEKSKNLTTYANALSFCTENQLTRSDLIIALGGGVTGDLSGFTASTYLRGIEYIQIPTSLLAMVDSSVGGKTAVDLPMGKNLVGAFYQPSLVLCDTETLKTLPEKYFTDGMAEVIKYGFICSSELLNILKNKDIQDEIENIIELCVKIKSDIVSQDENDKSVRQLLNFGHTIGHCIEKASNFSLSHGFCVAMGMAIISKAVKKLNIGGDITNQVEEMLTMYNLPVNSPYNAQTLIPISSSDKKRTGNSITLVIPQSLGQCDLYKTDLTVLEEIIRCGLED